jgi:riboflavin kinase/FMN adenylyltransferase
MRLRVERGLPEPGPRPDGPPAWVTIGNFDGVHRGHRAILDRVIGHAREAGGEAAVVTFDPHPRCVLQPDRCPPAVTTLEEKASILDELGVDRLVVLAFDLEMSRWSAEHFCERLVTAFALRTLVVGHDFALGHKRQGDIAFLRDWGSRCGFDVEALDPVSYGGEPFSSTRIRAALAAGDVAAAAELMGRPWFIDAEVEHGEKRGRALGFPTANLAIPKGKELPARGIYATRVRARDAWWMAATSIGVRPTFGGDHVTVEPHLLDFEGEMYGERVRCEFVARLREERAYATAAELVEQIGRDVEETRRLLSEPPAG